MSEPKVCGKCKEPKPRDAFHADRTRKDGKSRLCKECWAPHYQTRNAKRRKPKAQPVAEQPTTDIVEQPAPAIEEIKAETKIPQVLVLLPPKKRKSKGPGCRPKTVHIAGAYLSRGAE